MNPIEQLTEQVKEFKEKHATLLNEANTAAKEANRIAKEYDDKVKQLNADLAAKDATILDIQNSVKELQAKSGHLGNGGVHAATSVEDLISKSFESPEAVEILKAGKLETPWKTDPVGKKMPFRSKAAGTITLSSNVTGGSIVGVPSWSDQIWGRSYDDMHFRDLFRIIESATGNFLFFRANTPVGEGSVGSVAPGGQKPLIDKDITLQPVNATYLAGVADIAKESLQDIPMLQSYITDELINDYLDVETATMFRALLAVANGPNSVPGTATYLVEKIIYLIANQRGIRNRPDRIILKPVRWAELLTTRPNDFSLPNAVTITPNGSVAIVGIPVAMTATGELNDNTVLVGDSRKAGIIQVVGEGLKLETFRQHDKAVYNNIISMRVEARVAPVIFRTEAFSKLTLS
jgi:uncharacterized protein YoxC